MLTVLTPSLPQPVQFPGRKVHIRACKPYIFLSYKNLISIVWVLMKIGSHANANKHVSRTGTFAWKTKKKKERKKTKKKTTHPHKKKKKKKEEEEERRKAYGFQICYFYWWFSSDMVVKGLNAPYTHRPPFLLPPEGLIKNNKFFIFY